MGIGRKDIGGAKRRKSGVRYQIGRASGGRAARTPSEEEGRASAKWLGFYGFSDFTLFGHCSTADTVGELGWRIEGERPIDKRPSTTVGAAVAATCVQRELPYRRESPFRLALKGDLRATILPFRRYTARRLDCRIPRPRARFRVATLALDGFPTCSTRSRFAREIARSCHYTRRSALSSPSATSIRAITAWTTRRRPRLADRFSRSTAPAFTRTHP